MRRELLVLLHEGKLLVKLRLMASWMSKAFDGYHLAIVTRK